MNSILRGPDVTNNVHHQFSTNGKFVILQRNCAKFKTKIISAQFRGSAFFRFQTNESWCLIFAVDDGRKQTKATHDTAADHQAWLVDARGRGRPLHNNVHTTSVWPSNIRSAQSDHWSNAKFAIYSQQKVLLLLKPHNCIANLFMVNKRREVELGTRNTHFDCHYQQARHQSNPRLIFKTSQQLLNLCTCIIIFYADAWFGQGLPFTQLPFTDRFNRFWSTRRVRQTRRQFI